MVIVNDNSNNKCLAYETFEIASAQKMLIYAMLASIIGTFLWPLMIITIPFQMYAMYKILRALDYSEILIVLLIFAMFLPLISLLILAIVNSQATYRLKQAGLRVGLFGAKIADMN